MPRTRKPPEKYKPEDTRPKPKQKKKTPKPEAVAALQEAKKTRAIQKEIDRDEEENLKIDSIEDQRDAGVAFRPENPTNLGFFPHYDKKHFDNPFHEREHNSDARMSYEIQQAAAHTSKYPPRLWHAAPGFSKMVKDSLAPPRPHKEIIQRKYFQKKILFQIDDIKDDVLKLKLINEAIGAQSNALKTLFMIPELNEKIKILNSTSLYAAPHGYSDPFQILEKTKTSFIIALIFASLNRLKILNNVMRPHGISKEYVDFQYTDIYIQPYLMIFGAFCLMFFQNHYDFNSITDADILSNLFNIYQQYAGTLFPSWGQGKEVVDSYMNDILAQILNIQYSQKYRKNIKTVDFNDLKEFNYLLRDIGTETGNALLTLNRKNLQVPAPYAVLDEDRIPERGIAKIPSGKLRIHPDSIIKKEKKNKKNIPLMATLYKWNPGYKSPKIPKKLEDSKAAMFVKKYTNGGGIKEFKKLLNKKQKDSYKNFKLINNLETKLKNIENKILLFKNEKKKNKNKKIIYNISKNIKIEEQNKIKLKKNIRQNKKKGKIILKELKKMDNIYIKKKGGKKCPCAEKK